MHNSANPSSTNPGATDTPSDPANASHSGDRHCAAPGILPLNIVEISQILEPESSDKTNKTRRPGKDESTAACFLDDDEQEVLEERLPSSITLDALLDAKDRRAAFSEIAELEQKLGLELAAEKEAEKLAKERATEDNCATYEPAVYEEEEDDDDEEVAQQKQVEVEPDQRFTVTINGNPAKTAGIDVQDLILHGGEIEEARYVSSEDGVVRQYCKKFDLPWYLRCWCEPLYNSLILPTGIKSFRNPRELFHDISSLLRKYVMLPNKECSLLAYWAIATWFADYITIFPSIVISGPLSTADLLLRTLVCCLP